MLLTLTASSTPNFILIGPGLVWQTLPAGWVDTFESHYMQLELLSDTSAGLNLIGKVWQDPLARLWSSGLTSTNNCYILEFWGYAGVHQPPLY